MSGLLVKDICKSFDGTKVLERINLELPDGELLVLLGPSGCGKSTLLRIISGLESADEGEIHIGGRRVDHLAPRERNVALVFQNYSLYPHMSIAKNLAFPLKIAKMPKEKIKTLVRETAAMIGLEDRLDDRPGQLSGGQRQRVALGRAIIRDPSIFLLDEPLSNLDAELRHRMRQEIVALQKRLGRTMVHVTHDQAEALTMADRIAVMNNGIIEQTGSPEDLYDCPENLFVAGFIGYPRMNLLDAKVLEGRTVPFGIPLVETPIGTRRTKFVVGLRPEKIRIETGGPYDAVVIASEYMGDSNTVRLKFQEREIVVSAVERKYNAGENITFDFDMSSVHYFDVDTGARL